MSDRLAEIRERLDWNQPEFGIEQADVEWLVGEVERLRVMVERNAVAALALFDEREDAEAAIRDFLNDGDPKQRLGLLVKAHPSWAALDIDRILGEVTE